MAVEESTSTRQEKLGDYKHYDVWISMQKLPLDLFALKKISCGDADSRSQKGNVMFHEYSSSCTSVHYL